MNNAHLQPKTRSLIGVSDHLETEQKYDADTDFVLPELGDLPGCTAMAPKRYHLSATYFDTEDLGLIRNRVTLRRRTGGSDEGWHLKLPVRQDTRQEVHAPLGEGGQDSVPARLAAQVADITAGQPLHAIANLDTERTVVTLTGRDGEQLAEVADDRVTARRLDEPGAGPLEWREIEVEALSPGGAAVLEAAGKKLREAGARTSSSASKLARLLGR
jgi:inorganic triphosphatase YgiF